MKVYGYSQLTGEFTKEIEARPNPREEGKYLIPANTVTTAPPAYGANKIPVLENGAWVLKDDYRTPARYSTVNGAKILVNLGDPEPANSTTVAPPSSDHYWDGTTWLPVGLIGVSETATDTDSDGRPDVQVGASNTYTIQLKDSNGNNVGASGVVVTATVTAGALDALTKTTDANGQCQFVLTASSDTVQSNVSFSAPNYKTSYKVLQFIPV